MLIDCSVRRRRGGRSHSGGGVLGPWITAVVVAIRYLTGSRGSAASATSSGHNRPDDVLAERFARGEIDENE